MILLIKLLIAHLIGDFVLQSENWVKDKEEKKVRSLALYYHILVHIAITSLILWDYSLIPIAILIGVSHYIIDLCKLSLQNEKNRRRAFALDQFTHFIVLLIIANYHESFIDTIIINENKDQLYLIALAIITLMPVSSITIKVMVSKWTPKTEDHTDDSLKDAGHYIGILERLFVFGFVISGQIQAVGFLLAAKSVFRFGDLKDPEDRKLTEYILIGTFLSFGTAMLIGYAYLYLRQKI